MVYMESLEPEVRSAINSIYDELMGNGTTGPVIAGAFSSIRRPSFSERGYCRCGCTGGFKSHTGRSQDKRDQPRQSRFVVWFWNLRQRCDKVAEGRCF